MTSQQEVLRSIKDLMDNSPEGVLDRLLGSELADYLQAQFILHPTESPMRTIAYALMDINKMMSETFGPGDSVNAGALLAAFAYAACILGLDD